jgi:hypothetical protein
VGAVGAAARREIGVPIEKEGRALILHRRCDPCAFVGLRQGQQHGGNVGGGERCGEPIREPGRILRGYEIKARSRAPRFGRSFSGGHGSQLPPQSGGLGALL